MSQTWIRDQRQPWYKNDPRYNLTSVSMQHDKRTFRTGIIEEKPSARRIVNIDVIRRLKSHAQVLLTLLDSDSLLTILCAQGVPD